MIDSTSALCLFTYLMLSMAYLYSYQEYKNKSIDVFDFFYIFSFAFWISYPLDFWIVNHYDVARLYKKAYSYNNDLFTLFVAAATYVLISVSYMKSRRYLSMGTLESLPGVTKIKIFYNEQFDNLNKKSIFVLLALITVLKVLSYLYLYFRYGFIGSNYNIGFMTGLGPMNLVWAFGWIVLTMACLFDNISKKEYLFIFSIAFINSSFALFLDYSKSGFMFSVVLGVYVAYRNKMLNNKKMILMAIFLLCLVAFSNMFRYMLKDGIFDSRILDLSNTFIALGVSFDSFHNTAIGFFKFPIIDNFFGIVGLKPFFDELISIIPRFIWVDKPLVYGTLYIQNIVLFPENYAVSGMDTGRYPIGLVGMSYVIGGVPGILLFSILMGACFALLYMVGKNGKNVLISTYLVLQTINIYATNRNGIINLQHELMYFIVFLVFLWGYLKLYKYVKCAV